MTDNNKLLSRLEIIAYFILSVNSYANWIKWNPFASSLTSTFCINVFVFIIILYPSFKYRHIANNFKLESFKIFNLFFLYTVGLSIYSLLVNTSGIKNQDFASLWAYIQAMLTLISVYTLIQPIWFNKIFRIILKSIPWLLILLIPISRPDNLGGLFGFILRPIVFILIFISIFKYKDKFFYLLLAVIAMVLSFFNDARSNLIIPLVTIIIGVIVKYKFCIFIMKKIVWLLIIAPFIFLFLGINGYFNIFETDKYINNRSFDEGTISDTRTFVYMEVFSSAVNNNYIVWGRGIGRGYESLFQENITKDILPISARSSAERHSEVGIHNIFTWGGIVYVIIYTFMWCSIVYYGMYKSCNRYIPALAFYLAFYFFYFWVENFQGFTISFISSWFMVALCISPYFRKMSDIEFKEYINKLLK